MNSTPDVNRTSLVRTYRSLRSRIGRLKSSNYDISDTCNLTCEGCLYFSRTDDDSAKGDGTLKAWEERFAAEAERGINFAYLAGAEPALVPDRIEAAARHIPNGTIFTNGTKPIRRDIGYRIHVSLWGVGDTSGWVRGADVNQKAFRNYRDDPRAVFVFTVHGQNIDEIQPVAETCAEHGVILTYSYFSPTEQYSRLMAENAQRSDPYFRLGGDGHDLRLDGDGLARAREEISAAMARFPETVRYSMHYNDWISQPVERLWQLDENNVAIDCGNRLTRWHKHYAADATENAGKCCSPNIDCSECRAYAMGLASYLTRHAEFKDEPEEFAAWLGTWQLWADLFLPLEQHAMVKGAPIPARISA